MFDWNDLEYFLAVARHGSTLAGSRALGVDQSTVQRRLAELERRIGLKLVRRDRSGYHLTETGISMLAHAERVEQAIARSGDTDDGAGGSGKIIVQPGSPDPNPPKTQGDHRTCVTIHSAVPACLSPSSASAR
jgi:DNA-binding transcriptional LysR family regulator